MCGLIWYYSDSGLVVSGLFIDAIHICDDRYYSVNWHWFINDLVSVHFLSGILPLSYP